MAEVARRRKRVNRCLFGREEKTGETDEWLSRQLREMEEENRRKWNFRFGTDSPLDGGDWEWTPVSAASVPSFYIASETSAPVRHPPPLPSHPATEPDDDIDTCHKISKTNSGIKATSAPMDTAKKPQIKDYFPAKKRGCPTDEEKSAPPLHQDPKRRRLSL